MSVDAKGFHLLYRRHDPSGRGKPDGYVKRADRAFSLNVPKPITENRKDGSGTHRHSYVNEERESHLS